MSVLLINPFTVPLDKADEFVRDWTKTTEVYSKPGSGVIETHLHRRTGVGSASFEFINIATWESTAAFEAAHAAYGPSEEKIPGVVAHPALYEAIINDVFSRQKPLPSTRARPRPTPFLPYPSPWVAVRSSR